MWQGVVIHHSASKDDIINFESENIKRYHLAKGWRDIGYHYVIEKVKSGVWIITGRLLTEIGAHCKNYNNLYLGICFVGNFNNYKPDKELLKTGAKLIKSLMRIFHFDYKKIFLHKELNNTNCPGKYFDKEEFINFLIKDI